MEPGRGRDEAVSCCWAHGVSVSGALRGAGRTLRSGGRAGGLQRARGVGGDRGLRGWNQGLAGRDECVEEMGGLRRGSG